MLDGRIWLKRTGVLVALLLTCVNFGLSGSQAQAAPDVVNYQSRLRDILGNPVVASTTIQFSIYNHATNGAPTDVASETGPLLWSETYDQGVGACAEVTPDTQGYFDVQLGNCVSFPDYLDFQETLYLGVKIEADNEASPRVLLAAHPFSMNAGRVGPFADSGSDELVGEALGTATAVTQGYNSPMLVLQGSGWTGAAADERELKVLNTVTDADNYQLSVLNHNDVEIFSLDSEGLLGIGNDTPATALHVDSNSANDTAIVTIENSAGDLQIFRADTTPEGSITADIGDLTVDTTNGTMYLKTSGASTNIGWESFALGNLGSYTQGSVTFANASGDLIEDNANFFWDDTNDRLGIGNNAPDYTLDVDGEVGVEGYIRHNEDSHTFMYFTPDRWQLRTGGRHMIDVQYADEEITINEGSTQTDFRIESGLDEYLLFTDGSEDQVGISTSTTSSLLDVGGGVADYIDGVDDVLVAGDLEVDGTIYGTVDGAITSAGNGLTLTSGEIDLGGDLDQNTYLNHQGFSFVVREFVGEPYTEFNGDNFKIIDSGDNREVRFGVSGTDFAGLTLEGANQHDLYYRDDLIYITSDAANFEGLTYAADYSADYTNRSLVDKEYVDNASINIFNSDGSLSEDRTFDLNGNYFIIENTGMMVEIGEDEWIQSMNTGIYFSELNQDSGGVFYTAENSATGEIMNTWMRTNDLSFERSDDNNLTSTSLDVSPENISITSDVVGFEGAVYAADYSSNYTNRSLVDKEYVDSLGGGGGTLDQSYDTGGAGVGRSIIADSGPVYISDAGQAETATFSDSLLKLNSGLGTTTFTDFPATLVVNSEPAVGEFAFGVTIMGNERTLGLTSSYELLTEAVTLSGNTITFSTNLRSLNITESASTTFLVSGSAAHDGMYQLVSLDPSGTVATVQTVIGGNPGFPAESVSADVLEGSVTFGNPMAERALEVTHGKDFTDAALKIRNYSQGSSLLATHNNTAATDPAVQITNNASGASGLHFSGSSVYSTTFEDITSNYYVMGDSNDMGTTSTGGLLADPYGVSPAFSAVGYGVVGYYNYVGAATAGNNLAGSVNYSGNANHLTGSPTRWAVVGAFETDEDGNVEVRSLAQIEPGGGTDDAEAVLESSHEDNGGDSVVHIEAHKRGAGNSGDAYIELEAAVDDTGTMDSWISFRDENDQLTFTQYGSSLGDDLLNAPGEVFSSTGTIGSSIGVGETSDSLVHALNAVGSYAAGIGAGGGGTLDQAYDFGGAGNGRTITADSGTIQFITPNNSNHSVLTITQNDATNDPSALTISNAGDGAAIEFTGVGGHSLLTDLTSNWIAIADDVTVADINAGFMIDPYGNNPVYTGLNQGAVGFGNYIGADEASQDRSLSFMQAMNDFPNDSPTRSVYLYLWETDAEGGQDVRAQLVAEVAETGDNDAVVEIKSINEDLGHHAYTSLGSYIDNVAANGNAYTAIQARVLNGTGDGFISFTDTRDDLAFTQDSAFFGDDLLNAAGEIFEATGTIGSVSGETSDSLVHALNAVGTYAAGLGAGAGGTLDQAYDFGGAGAGRLITADSGAVQITVPDNSNTAALSITQNDTTNYPGGIDFGSGYAAITNDLSSGWSIVGNGAQFSDLTSGLFIDPYGNDPSLGGSEGFSGIMNFIGAATAGVPTQQIVLNNSDDDFGGTITRYSRIILNETDVTGDVSIDFDARTTSAATGDSDMTFNVVSATNTGDAEFLVGASKTTGTSGESTILLQANNSIADDSTITLSASAGGTSTIQLLSPDGDVYFVDERENNLYLTQDSVALGGDLLNAPGEIYSSSGTIGSSFSESSLSLIHAINAVGTYAAGIGAGAGGTLDMAYDFGGSGAGRIITADSDEVQIIVPDGSGNVGLEIVQNDTTVESSVLQLTNNTDSGASIEFSGTGPQVLEADLTTNFFMMSDGPDLGTTTGGLIYDPYGNESYFAAGDMGIAGIYNFTGAVTSGRETQGSAIYASNQNFFTGTPTRSATIAALENAGSDNDVEAQFYSEIADGGGSSDAVSHVRSRNSDDGGDAQTWIEADKEGVGYVGNAYITISATTDLDPNQRSWIEFEDDNESLNFTQYNSALGDDLLNSAGEIFSSTGTLGSVIGGGGETSTSIVHALNSLGNYVVNFGGAGGGTLDASYDTGGAGAGRSITADSGAVEITVPDTSNNAALTINQNDVTNNPPAIDFGSGLAYMNNSYSGGGYSVLGDGVDFTTLTGGLIIDPYSNEGSLGGNTGLVGLFNFIDPDDIGIDTQVVAMHTGDDMLMSGNRYAQFLVQDNGDGNEVQGIYRGVTSNSTNGDTDFQVYLQNTNTNGDSIAQFNISNNPSTNGDARFYVHATAGNGNSEVDFEVDSVNNGGALITLNADSSGGGGLIHFRDNQEPSLYFTQTGSALGDDLLNDAGEIFADDGSIGSTIGAGGETSTSIVHALNALGTYTASLGAGSSYWSKTGTDLSPTNPGDDLLLNTGETLSIADMTTGSMPFIGSSGLLSQDNTNLFWDDGNNRLGIGTNTPGVELDVSGDIRVTDWIYFNDGGSSVSSIQYDNVGNYIEIGNAAHNTKILADSNGVADFGDGYFSFYATTRHSFATDNGVGVPTERLRITDNTGYIGIGDPSPSAMLDVGGGVVNFIDGTDDLLVADDLEVDGTIYGTLSGSLDSSFTTGSVMFADASGDLDEDNANLFWDDTNKYLGIGTNSPSEMLAVRGTDTSNYAVSITHIGDASTNNAASLRVTAGGGAGALYLYRNEDAATTDDALFELYEDGASDQNVMYLTNDGTGNALLIDQIGDVGFATSSSGALFVRNDAPGIGLNVYSRRAAVDADGPLVSFTEDDGSDQDVLKIQNDGTGNAIEIDQNGAGGVLSADQDSNINMISLTNNGTGSVFDARRGTAATASAFASFRDTNSSATANLLELNTQSSGFALYVSAGESYFLEDVGIGDDSPAALLDVGGGVASNIDGTSDLLVADDIEADGNITLDEYLYYNNATTEYLRHDTTTFILSDDLLPSADDTFDLGSSTVRWQDLYLGPATLHIGADGDETAVTFDTTNDLLTFQNSTDSTNGFQFLDADGGTSILNIDTTNERVGIGTDSPSTKFQVVGQVRASSFANANGTAGSPSYRFNDDSNTGMYRISADTLGFSTSGSEVMRLSSSGIVGIGDTDPTNGGLVVASGVTIGVDSGDNLIDDETHGTGSATLYIGQNTIDTTAPSDERLKRDITATELSIEDLMAVEIVDFRYRSAFTDDDETFYHGVIAQQVEDIYPIAVTTRSDGYKMVDYKSFIPLVMKSIQDQQGVIETIQNSMNDIQETESVEQGSGSTLVMSGEVDNLVVKKHTTFNGDTVGLARILKYETNVQVEFEEEYQYQPIVTATLMNYLHEDIDYIIKDVTLTGFNIEIDKMYGESVEFSWHAFGSNNAKLFISDGTTEEIELVIDQGECGVDNLNACDTLDECKQLTNYYWDGQCHINDPVEGMVDPDEQIDEEPEEEEPVEEEEEVVEEEPVIDEEIAEGEEEEEEVVEEVEDDEPMTEEEVEEDVGTQHVDPDQEETVVEEEPAQPEEAPVEESDTLIEE